MLVTLAVCSMAVQLLALANPPLYKRHRTYDWSGGAVWIAARHPPQLLSTPPITLPHRLLMGSLRVVCNLLTTLSYVACRVFYALIIAPPGVGYTEHHYSTTQDTGVSSIPRRLHDSQQPADAHDAPAS